ncbi:MAG: hypothetical protein JNK76_19110 [Planctomycetales bacterium]|nr:hypothetical protein [Planctomycetales bacterium]MBN8627920.1 hypothetical protein [Planctomycetota bacterium]
MFVVRKVCLLLSVAIIDVASAEELHSLPSSDHLIAAHLPGSWEPDEELTRRLGGTAIGVLKFEANEGAVKWRLTPSVRDYFADFPIRQIGYFNRPGVETSYVLLDSADGPLVVWFHCEGALSRDVTKTLRVALVPGQSPLQDLLFLAERDERLFAAYRRVDRVAAGLRMKISMHVDRDTPDRLLAKLAEAIKVPLSIEAVDLRLAGITKGHSIGCDEADQPAVDVLVRLLWKAHPDGILIYVVRPGADGSGEIAICTKEGALKRGETIPPGFDVKPKPR